MTLACSILEQQINFFVLILKPCYLLLLLLLPLFLLLLLLLLFLRNKNNTYHNCLICIIMHGHNIGINTII